MLLEACIVKKVNSETKKFESCYSIDNYIKLKVTQVQIFVSSISLILKFYRISIKISIFMPPYCPGMIDPYICWVFPQLN